MFSIFTAGEFLAKAEADVASFEADIANAGLAINCALSLYHVHEWLRARHLKDLAPVELDGMTIARIGDFRTWCDEHIAHFETVQALANGAKHLKPTQRRPRSWQASEWAPTGSARTGWPTF